MDFTLIQYRAAVAAFERRDYGEAVRLLTEVLVAEPSNLSVLELRARAHFHRASLAPAEADARAILDRCPTDEYANILLARVLERQSRHDEAMGVRRVLAAITGDPGHLDGGSIRTANRAEEPQEN